MNPEPDPSALTSSSSAHGAPPPPAGLDWRYWLRRLLVCNPFFIISAALLLFGVNRLSLDPDFLGEESRKLLFNFGALQLYEALVAFTAIVLARRKVWYDSALLVVMENGLVVVPFMLISQATLIARPLGLALASVALALALVRARTLQRFYPRFNLPARALALGAAFLLLNASLPAAFRLVIEEGQERWQTPHLALWYFVLPLIVAGANLLPRPRHYGGLNPERHWLPLFIYGLWTTGTATHFLCLGYISQQEFQLHHLAPAAAVASWTMWRRITDCLPAPGIRWEVSLLILTFVAPFVGFKNSLLFESLVVVNAIAYGLLMARRSGAARTLVREFVFATPALLVLGLPAEFVKPLWPAFHRPQLVTLAFATFMSISAWRSFRLPSGVAGAIAAPIALALLRPDSPNHAFVETGVVFLLAHSLGLRQTGQAAQFLRSGAAALWVLDAARWIHGAPLATDFGIATAGLMLLGVFALVWRVCGRRDWLVFTSALTVVCAAPADWLMREGSAGLIALIASLTLFGVGFAVAWTRTVWDGAASIHGRPGDALDNRHT